VLSDFDKFSGREVMEIVKLGEIGKVIGSVQKNRKDECKPQVNKWL
jgi:hypothetical protein